jgi:hypothetical protein
MNNDKWISVADRLPEIGQTVLVWMIDDNSEYGGRRYEYADVWTFDNANQYFCDHTPKSALKHAVTYWMPLPAPPNGGAQ